MIKDSFCGDKEVSYTGIMADTSIHTPDTAGVDLPQAHTVSLIFISSTLSSAMLYLSRDYES